MRNHIDNSQRCSSAVYIAYLQYIGIIDVLKIVEARPGKEEKKHTMIDSVGSTRTVDLREACKVIQHRRNRPPYRLYAF